MLTFTVVALAMPPPAIVVPPSRSVPLFTLTVLLKPLVLSAVRISVPAPTLENGLLPNVAGITCPESVRLPLSTPMVFIVP